MAEVRPIDANALLTKAHNYYPSMDHYCISRHAVDTKDIEDAHTLDYEPVRHGEWKYYHKKNRAVCTACSFERNLDDDFGRAISCPNCGAKMDGGKNNG